MARECSEVDVCLERLDDEDTPHCPHGPTLLFQRYKTVGPVGKGGGSVGQRFYACSACRDRKDCNFFQLEGDKISEVRKKAREEENKQRQPAFSHTELYKRGQKYRKLPESQRKFCEKCGHLLLPKEWSQHASHPTVNQVTDEQLETPSFLLMPLENKKSNAQYLFSEKTASFLLGLIKDLGFTRVLCVGTPRIHEAIMKRPGVEGQDSKLQSLLLDIDYRFGQFYSSETFCRYNMFNHHFFEGEDSERTFKEFVCGGDSESTVMVMDPPFGGLVDVLAHSVKRIMAPWKNDTEGSRSDSAPQMPVMWVFPYFLEPRILQCLPTFMMLDYKVDYDNHQVFKTHKKSGKGNKRGSPVRIFTNLSPEKVKLPAKEGYRFCSKCKRYVSEENKHCKKCNACTSKDGRAYVHCDKCRRCVKSSRVHCEVCKQCQLPQHQCGEIQTAGCHICGDLTHKRRNCPNREQPKGKKRKGNAVANTKHKRPRPAS